MESAYSILIVDDSTMLRTMTRRHLNSAGFENILEAVDGKEALDIMMEHQVDLIFSGMNMPKVNGTELLNALVNHSSLKSIPFVVLTSDIDTPAFKNMMEIGAAGYLQKPFTQEDLNLKIREFMQ